MRVRAVNAEGEGAWASAAGITAIPPPAFVSASVDADTLTLTFDKALDESSIPAAEFFAVEVTIGDGEPMPAAVGAVRVSGNAIVLTLETAVRSGYGVTVRYTGSNANPLTGEGGAVPAFDLAQPATNDTPPNRSPAFPSARIVRGVSENAAPRRLRI